MSPTEREEHDMADTAAAMEQLRSAIGERRGPGEWITVDQPRINLFADATEDHQWIHVDVERANAGPFGGPIGHGFLSLSLIPALTTGLMPRGEFAGGINYGSNKVRFPQPVPVDTRVRAFVTLLEAVEHPMGIMVTQKVEVEGEGLAKPVCVAETLSLLFV